MANFGNYLFRLRWGVYDRAKSKMAYNEKHINQPRRFRPRKTKSDTKKVSKKKLAFTTHKMLTRVALSAIRTFVMTIIVT